MINKKYFIFILVMLATKLPGQFLLNPSFEGPPAIGLSPTGWLPFNTNSTPDTEPISCDYFLASKGETYMTLVTRGEESTFINTIENAQTALAQPLRQDYCYTISIDLASRDDVGHSDSALGLIWYLSPIKLQIYGSNSEFLKGNLLIETEEITESFWQTYTFTIKPLEEINFLVLEISHSNAATGLGNLQIDNMVIQEDMISSIVKLDETFQSSDLPIVLNSSESESYSWSPTIGLTCYDCQSPEVNSNTNRTYTCTLPNLSGCPSRELFVLRFEDENLSPQGFNIPNVFTPNEDGYNDYFEIPNLPPFSSLIIFNRSGKKLYISEEYNNDWNGLDMEDQELPEGTYWYILITPGFTGKYKGHVYLKRKN